MESRGAVSGFSESDLVESAFRVSAFSESLIESAGGAGGMLRGISMGRGTQSLGSVSQSCMVESASDAWDIPAWALPQAIRPDVRNAVIDVERNARVRPE
jgi:hypothetical protein